MPAIDELNRRGIGTLPGLMGLEASATTVADTSCGYGTSVNLPEGAVGFTTIELKSNFIETKRSGAIGCEAELVHDGRKTQVWDATIFDEGGGKPIALFRCTQMILYPR